MKQKEAQKVIKNHAKEYRDFLNLVEWDIQILYMEEPWENNEFAAMTMDVDISYLRGTLKVYPPAWENCDEDYIKCTLVHELCHIITEPMYSLARANVNPHLHPFVEEQREQETERIARIAQKALGLL